MIENGAEVSEEIQILANEPFMISIVYSSYTIYGFNFHTHSYDEGRPVQSLVIAFPGRPSRGTGTRIVVRRSSILFGTTSAQLQHVPKSL
jgi:hypothetical protein